MSLLPCGWTQTLDLDREGRLWLKTHIPDDDDRAVLLGPVTSERALYAVPTRLLDDYQDRLDRWREMTDDRAAYRDEVLATYRSNAL